MPDITQETAEWLRQVAGEPQAQRIPPGEWRKQLRIIDLLEQILIELRNQNRASDVPPAD